MSYVICPALPLSMAKGLHKSPVFNPVVQRTAASRGNSSFSLTPYPTWAFEFDLDAIQGNEAAASSALALFMGTYMACGASNGLFLFTDPQDSAVAYANSGMLDVTAASTTPMAAVGNGVSTQFQLARSFAGMAWDVLQNINGSIAVKVNGSVVVPASVSSTGVVTFTTAPAASATLQWAGNFYFLCRFTDNSVDSTRSFTTNSGIDQWDINGVKFASEFV
jgi:hypothetical protein